MKNNWNLLKQFFIHFWMHYLCLKSFRVAQKLISINFAASWPPDLLAWAARKLSSWLARWKGDYSASVLALGQPRAQNRRAASNVIRARKRIISCVYAAHVEKHQSRVLFVAHHQFVMDAADFAPLDSFPFIHFDYHSHARAVPMLSSSAHKMRRNTPILRPKDFYCAQWLSISSLDQHTEIFHCEFLARFMNRVWYCNG